MKKCYYQVLEVDRKVSPGDLKTAFRKQALKWHPDKNPSPQATEIFQGINQAYSVLSDPQERKWYDDHREQILMGAELGSQAASYIIADNLFKYFSTSIFKNNYSDEKGGFFDVFNTLFQTLDQEEDAAVYARTKNPQSDDQQEEPYQKLPKFGNSFADPGDVKAFYNDWLDFHSRKKFAFMDKYNPNEGPNRKIKRLIVQQNLKERMKEKKKLNEAVRSLVAWVQKRDPRWKEIQRLRKEELELKEEMKKKQREAAKQAKKEMRKKAMEQQAQRLDQAEEQRLIRGYEEELAKEKMKRKLKKGKKLGVEEWKAQEDDWISSKKSKQQLVFKNKKKWKQSKEQAQKTAQMLEKSDDDEQEEKEEEVQSSEEPDEFLCEPCAKVFKSKEQLKNHFDSKKHKRNVREIMKELKITSEQLKAQKQTEVTKEEEIPEVKQQEKEKKEDIKVVYDPEKKRKKKSKKMKKKWNQLQEDQQSSSQENEEPKQEENEEEQENVDNEEQRKSQQSSSSITDQEEENALNDAGLLAMSEDKVTQSEKNGKLKIQSKKQNVKDQKEEEKEEKEEEKEITQVDQEEGEDVPYESLSKKEKRKLKQKAKQSLADWVCNVCAKEFDTRNALFKHLKQKGHQRAMPDAPPPVEIEEDFGQKRGKKKKNKKY